MRSRRTSEIGYERKSGPVVVTSALPAISDLGTDMSVFAQPKRSCRLTILLDLCRPQSADAMFLGQAFPAFEFFQR